MSDKPFGRCIFHTTPKDDCNVCDGNGHPRKTAADKEAELWSTRVARAAKLPREDKQRALDLMHSGKSVGEMREIMNWDLALASAVIVENIENVEYLRREAR